MKKRILFLDRDGTILQEPPEDYQVDSFEKMAFLPGVIRNLHRLLPLDYVWVMITNQDGLGTDAFPEADFWPPHQKMMEILEGEGISFHEVVIDKTFKHEGAPTRKPGTALLNHYLDGSYDLENSVVVGDRPSDIKLAENLGAKGILLGRSTDAQDDDHDLQAMASSLLLQTDSWDEIADVLLQPKGRTAIVRRSTAETDISVSIDLDGKGESQIETGIGFFDHMLDQLAKHSRTDMQITVKGDLEIDPHHSIEDAGLALGQAFKEALGDKRGISRYGCFNLVMDEALAEVALDFSGRPYMVWKADIRREKVGDFPVEMAAHFFKSFCDTSGTTLRIQLDGQNAHHMLEAAFKGVARSIRMAKEMGTDPTEMPSTKGVL